MKIQPRIRLLSDMIYEMRRKDKGFYFISLISVLLSVLSFEIAIADESADIAFLKAIYAKDFQRMENLLKEGVDVNAPIRNGLPPLAEAAYQGDIGIVEFLLRKGAKVEGTNAFPNSPVFFAIYKGNIEVVRRFLDLGISPNYSWPAGDGTGGTLLTEAVDSGHMDIVELLVKRGADVNFRGSGSITRTSKAGIPVASIYEKGGF